MLNKRSLHITFTEPLLGSLNNNPEIFKEFTEEKAFRESKTHTAAKAAEEVGAVLGEMPPEEAEETITKQTTVFPRNTDGTLFCWDYQWRGFFKEALGIGTEIKEEAMGNLSKWTIKKTVDAMLFVIERRIQFLDATGQPIKECTQLERPLRAQTMRGERICLARSEILPAGTQVRFTLAWMQNSDPKSKMNVKEPALIWALDYGALKGFGQWRGGGYGRFSYTISEVAPKAA